MYLLTVTQQTAADGSSKTWDVYRRYSDFHELHHLLIDKVSSVNNDVCWLLSGHLILRLRD